MKLKYLLVLLVLPLCHLPVCAGVLQAMVQGVRDGRTLAVLSGGRQVMVVLEGVDVPDPEHTYGIIASKHLSDLTLGKQVTVEYSAYGAKGYLVARVFCNQIDIGQQMIRDGAARYNKEFDANLSDQEQALYLKAETLARLEKRGVWSDASGLVDVDWLHSRSPKKQPSPTLSSSQSTVGTLSAPQTGNRQKLSNTSGEVNRAGNPGSQIKWPMYRPPGAPFSLRVPNGGRDANANVQLSDGREAKLSFYSVQHPGINYVVFWGDGPYIRNSISTDFEDFLGFVQDSLQAQGYPCHFTKYRPVLLNGFRGTQYNVRGCAYHGGFRLFFRVEGAALKVIMVTALSDEASNPQVDDFLDSLNIDK
jgi:endonuclease YncB( thermonuclease family)